MVMFLRLIALVFVLLGTNVAIAEVRPGVKIGLNASGVNSYDTKISCHAGVFVNIDLNKSFCFSPEVLYSREGFEAGYPDVNRIRLNYMRIPFMFQYIISKDIPIGFELGPQVGVLLNACQKTDESKTNLNNCRDFDCGLVAGLLVDLNKFIVQIRYCQGITTIIPNTNYRNNNIQASLGFRF